MCLIAKDLPKKCKKTIVVYKELKVFEYADIIHLRTPFRDVPVDSLLMIAEPIQSKRILNVFVLMIQLKKDIYIHLKSI